MVALRGVDASSREPPSTVFGLQHRKVLALAVSHDYQSDAQ